jgi:hypothetical protein
MKNKVNKGGSHLKNTGLPSRNSAGHKTGHGTRHNVRIHIVGYSISVFFSFYTRVVTVKKMLTVITMLNV